MFGFGRRRDGDLRRLEDREKELAAKLQQVTAELEEANKRAGDADSRVVFLAGQNRALAAKVHRMALQRLQLQSENDRMQSEQKQLGMQMLALQNEQTVSQQAHADYRQVQKLQGELKAQAARYENKLDTLKRRTCALLTAVLPKSTTSAVPTPRNSSGLARTASDAPESLECLAVGDVEPFEPLQLDAETRQQARVLEILACLYDDSIDEDQALQRLTTVAMRAVEQPRRETTVSASTATTPQEELPAGPPCHAMCTADASTVTSPRPVPLRMLADAATETPAELSYFGTPYDMAATPMEPGGSPRAGGAPAVPRLDLAALVAQAMDASALHSTRSTSSSAAAVQSTFANFTNFVLAEPEKLQRLIMRAQRPQQVAQKASAGSSAAGSQPLGRSSLGPMPTFRDPQQLMGGAGDITARFTNGLLGLGVSASSGAPPAAKQQVPAASAAPAISGVDVPAASKTPKKAAPAKGAQPKIAAIGMAVAGPAAKVGMAAPAAAPVLPISLGRVGGALSTQASFEDDLKMFSDNESMTFKGTSALVTRGSR